MNSECEDMDQDEEMPEMKPCENVSLESDSSQEQHELLSARSPSSDSVLVTSSKSLHVPTFSKILQWDPWSKIGRKKKKDKGKMKCEGSDKKELIVALMDSTEGSSLEPQQDLKKNELFYETDLEPTFPYDMKPGKFAKMVRFQTEAIVVHYSLNEILDQTREPLKKEIEQQERNKELRKKFSPETVTGLKINGNIFKRRK